MEKNLDYYGLFKPNSNWHKFILTMKITAFLLFSCLVNIFAAPTYSQSTKISLNLKDVTIEEVLNKIENVSEFYFLYNNKLIDVTRKVNIEADKEPIKDILNDMLSKDTKFIVYDRQIILTPSDVTSLSAAMQQLKITGKVTDASTGEAMPGVNIMVKGTTIGAITGGDGMYSLSVTAKNATLVISFIGYVTQEIPFDGSTIVDVAMQPGVNSLAEVVVIGYGTLTREKISSSIASVETGKIQNQLTPAIDRSLEGQISGVVVKQNTGAPGGGASIKIRGTGSFGSGDDPLFVVDGIPYSNTFDKERSPLAFLDQSDIESIDVLKDVSACAIYGSRGANGVVLITTKSAKLGKTQIQVSVRGGVQSELPSERLDLCNAYEFAKWKHDNYYELAAFNGTTVNELDIPAEYRNPDYWKGKGCDWQDVIFRIAPTQSYNINITHGTEKFKSFFSIGYTNDEGIIVETNFKRLNMRSNMNYALNKVISTGLSMSSSVIWWGNKSGEDRGGAFGNPVVCSPLDGPYVDDYPNEDLRYVNGKWDEDIYSAGMFHFPNTLYNLTNITNKAQDLDLNIQPFLQITPLKGLLFKSQLNMELGHSFSKYFDPSTNHTGWETPPIQANGNYQTGNSYNWQFENTLTYSRTFGDHSISAFVGYTMERYYYENSSLYGWNFPNDLVTTLDASGAQSGSTAETASTILSSMARVNYDYKAKYLFTATLRRDGSSRFGSDSRWGYFPSFSVGWNVTKENFFPKPDWLTNLKLRGSFGEGGNNNIGDYTWISLLARADHNFGEIITPGLTPSGISNTKLAWEKSKETDGGFDLALLNGRLSFVADYYERITSSMLWNVSIPVSSGYTNMEDNIGKVRNRGFEFSIHSENIATNDFKWETDFNISFLRNKVLSLGGHIKSIENNIGFGVHNITVEGKPMAQFYGFKLLGIFNTVDEIKNSATFGAQLPGTPHWEDINKDGKIDLNDKIIIGSPYPDFTGGMSNRFTYKKWDLIVNMSFAYNFDVAAALETTTLNLGGAFNVTTEIDQRWKSPEDPGNGRVSCSFQQTGLDRDQSSSKFIYNTSFLKFQSINLGYTFSLNSTNQLRLSLSLQNPWLITNYKYGNPDVNRYGSSSLLQGADEYDYPLARSIEVGLTLTL